MTSEFHTITSLAEFEALKPQWDRLVLAMATPTPFMLHSWLAEWWRHHGKDRSMLVAALIRDGEVVAGLPFEVEQKGPLRVLHFMGRHHAALADVVAGDPEIARASTKPLLERVNAVASPDYSNLFGLRAEAEFARGLDNAERLMVRRVDSPTLDLSKGWDVVYREKTSSRRRNLHKRRWRQLGDEGDVTISIAADPEAVAATMNDAFRLHDLRWRGRPDGSEFTTPTGRPFNEAAARRLAADGVVRMLMLHVAGKPVAFHYYFMLAQRMYVYRLAFDPALGKCSPGVLATLAALEAAAAEGATKVEYLGGGERYKVELSDDTSPMHQLIGLPSTIRGQVASFVTRGVLNGRLRLKESERARAFYFETLAPARRLIRRQAGDSGVGE
jgi:CelD/BcsL family acetyltransferase involved in cellulose biosynthesis